MHHVSKIMRFLKIKIFYKNPQIKNELESYNRISLNMKSTTSTQKYLDKLKNLG